MVSPTTFSPRARSIPATTELSTPPDIATAMVSAPSGFSGIGWRQFAQMRYGFTHGLDQRVHLRRVVRTAERETDTRLGLFASQAWREERAMGPACRWSR